MIEGMNTSRLKRNPTLNQMPLLRTDHMRSCVQAQVLGKARIALATLLLEAARGLVATSAADVSYETS